MITSFWVKTNLAARQLCYKQNSTDAERAEIITSRDWPLNKLNEHMNGKKFFNGDDLTIADIFFYDTWLLLNLIHEDSCKKYQNLYTLQATFEQQEWFQNFKNSDRWIERTFNGPMASINN